MNNKQLIATTALVGVLSMAGHKALAQSPSQQPAKAVVVVPDNSDEDIKLFRKDLRSLKKQIIAANLDLDDTEAEKFWPIYERYTAELVEITDGKYSVLQEYAQNYATLSDEQAESYIKGRADVEASILQLRLKYPPIFRKALSGRLTALFFNSIGAWVW